jgi:hypothetical protein
VPVRLKIDERDDMVILVGSDQDQAAVTRALMRPDRIQVSGNPHFDLSGGVIERATSRTVRKKTSAVPPASRWS